MASTIRDQQKNLLEWTQSHLPEVEEASPQSTLWYGVMSKCAGLVEELTVSILRTYDDAVRQVGGEHTHEKSLHKLTLGQQVEYLMELGDRLTPHLDALLGETHPSARMAKSQKTALQRLVRIRNDFAHGNFATDEALPKTIEFLKGARALCEYDVVSVATALEARTSPLNAADE